MTISRRDILLGLGASAGLAVSFPALATPSTGPIDLGQYFLPYWRNPVWKRHFHRGDWWPSLNAYSWHFDDKTYDTPLISCADNGRVFQIIRLQREEGPEIGVFEFWVTELMKPGTPDRYSNELAGAARFAADWALEAVPQRRDIHRGAVYISFDGDQSPVITDAPPLIVHPWLSLSVPVDIEYDDDPEDEFEEDELAEEA